MKITDYSVMSQTCSQCRMQNSDGSPIIPELERLRQEDYCSFEASLGLSRKTVSALFLSKYSVSAVCLGEILHCWSLPCILSATLTEKLHRWGNQGSEMSASLEPGDGFHIQCDLRVRLGSLLC